MDQMNKTTDSVKYDKSQLAYSAQEPWIFSDSVRQNILFGKEFEKKRYEETVSVCSLNHVNIF